MTVQRMDALVEATEVGLPQQPVPPRQHERWLGQQKKKVREPLLLWPERSDQSHREIGVPLTLATTLPIREKEGNVYMARLSQGWQNASSKTAWGSGTREQYRGSPATGSPKRSAERSPPVGGETTLSL